MVTISKTWKFAQGECYRLKSKKLWFVTFAITSIFVIAWIIFQTYGTLTCPQRDTRVGLEKYLPFSTCRRFRFVGATERRVVGNDTCTVIGCFSPGTPGSEIFWRFYSQSGYSAVLTSFTKLRLGRKKVHGAWCRIPAALRELERNPKTRVIYADIDTRLMDVERWCNMPHLGKKAPIIMTSLYRNKLVEKENYTVFGTQVQTNAFVVTPGRYGIQALTRWQNSYAEITYRDQGVLHAQEQGLCGIPGWIHCYGNPYQQSRHCGGVNGFKEKEACISRIFK